jgi:glycosyltransferase involved in cell wall biosynthesis
VAYRDHSVALVIPARNEQRLIVPTLESVPDIVDAVYVVDDGSTDQTAGVVLQRAGVDPRVHLLRHEVNTGPGAAIITGYRQAAADGYDLVVVVGGDNQMPMDEMGRFLDPLVEGQADYTKGNRFMAEGNAFDDMPKIRLIGNTVISLLTKISSGYYKIFDVVDGYTAITRDAIEAINWNQAWKKYGYPMDFLARLNAYGFTVMDMPRTAVYLPGERQSQIKGMSYALKVSPMLVRNFFWRLGKQYLFSDFHPLLFLYVGGFITLPLGVIMGFWLVGQKIVGAGMTGPTAMLAALLMLVGIQSLFFAMLFDMMESQDRGIAAPPRYRRHGKSSRVGTSDLARRQ